MASAFHNDDPTATAEFEAVTLPYMDALYGRAFNLANKEAEAGDLVQETYLRAFCANHTSNMPTPQRHFEDELQLLLDQRLDAPTRVEVEQHLATCGNVSANLRC